MNMQDFTPKQRLVPIAIKFPTIPDRRTQLALMDAFDRSGLLFKFASNPSEPHCELFRVQTSTGRALAGLVMAHPADDLPKPWNPGHRAAGQIVSVRPSQDVTDRQLRELRDEGLLHAEGYADCLRLKADPLSHVEEWGYEEGKREPPLLTRPMDFTPKL